MSYLTLNDNFPMYKEKDSIVRALICKFTSHPSTPRLPVFAEASTWLGAGQASYYSISPAFFNAIRARMGPIILKITEVAVTKVMTVIPMASPLV